MWRDMSTIVESHEGIIHEEHSLLSGGLKYRIHMLSITSDDEVSD